MLLASAGIEQLRKELSEIRLKDGEFVHRGVHPEQARSLLHIVVKCWHLHHHHEEADAVMTSVELSLSE